MNTMIKTLSIIALSLFGLTANAYDFMVNGIAYNINSDGNTVTVTYEVNSSGAHYIDEPEGQLTIPSSVSYNGKSEIYTDIDAGEYDYEAFNKILTDKGWIGSYPLYDFDNGEDTPIPELTEPDRW